MKNHQSMLFRIVLLSAAYISGCHGTDTANLSPQEVQSPENTNVTLTCSYEGLYAGSFQQGFFIWIRNSRPELNTSFTTLVPNPGCIVPTGWLNNSLLYSYRCINYTIHSVTFVGITQQLNGETYQCRPGMSTSELALSNIVTFRVTVAVKFVNVNTNMFTITENATFELLCTSSPCQPKPKFRWYISNNNNPNGGVSMLTEVAPIESEAGKIQSYNHRYSINPKRTWNDRFVFCGASNSDVDFILSAKILINITYPPDGPPRIETFENRSELKILEYGIVSLKCLSTGGNPLPRLEWNKNNEMPQIVSGSTVTKNITWQALDKNKEELRCESIHSLSRYTTLLYVNVLYPPETPTIKIKRSSGVYLQVYTSLHVIEGLPFTLNCSADSNPPVSLFQWNNLMPTDSSIFYVANADRRNAEDIACKVSNTMQTSDSITSMTGNNITSLKVNVLYPPTMNIAKEATIIEGDNLDNLCTFTRGNPPDTNITWSWKGSTWNVNPQQPYIVSRNQSGVYMCSVRNWMASSDGTRVFGNASGEFNLSVQYKTKVLRFVINEQNDKVNITINENDAVNLTCEIEGLPLPTGQLLAQSFLNQQVMELPRYLIIQTSTNLRLTSSFPAQCTDTGIHTCTGTNILFNGWQSASNTSIALFVMCKPRKSPLIAVLDRVASPTLVDVTLSFAAMAYPVPPESGYVWTRKVETSESWVNITSSGNKTNISNRGLQSNLTIKDVSQSDYGMYRLFIYNEVGQYNHTFNLVPEGSTNDATSAPSTNASIVAAGAATGGVAFLVAVIIIVVVYKKRLQNKKHDSHRQFIDVNISNEGYMELNHDGQQSDLSQKKSAVLPERQPKNMEGHGLQELDDFDENITTDFAVYGNAYEMIKRIERVDVNELFPYLTDKTAEFFAADYAKLPQGLTKPYEFSQKPENIALNRYHGIYPYDHSRVKIPSIPEYFTNACYIDGYKKKKAYIASLGPLSRTSNRFVMFWQMVWSEKSDVIVMLTKLTEPSGVKCEQYWPKDGTSIVYGEMIVTSTGEEVYSDFVMRTFSVVKGGQKRKLTHFHFMAWPDKSIPDDVTCILEFRRKVKATHTSGPMIVHCSAGIGRTGTLIAIDILIEEGQKKGSVNVLECVKTMREQRTNMVQTVDQYYYIFKTLVNALVFDNEAIPAEKIHKYVESSKHNRFSDMFQKFNQTVESDNTKETNSRIANNALTEKNRVGSDIPGDAHRVRLVLNRGIQTADYINAVYINSFRVADHFIVAQSPLLNGVEEFLCMIYQENCSCVVSMDGNQTRQTVGLYLPPDNANFTIGSFKVQCSRLETKETYIVRKMKIEFTGQLQGVEKVVYHFEFLGWSDGNKIPNDPRQFVEFTKDVERFADQFGTEGSHVLVHCLNAYERSCLFCAVIALTEKIKHEKEVCIPNTLRQIRTRRKLAIPTLEQFRFCYQAADAYLTMEKAGTNNAENSYMNVTMNS